MIVLIFILLLAISSIIINIISFTKCNDKFADQDILGPQNCENGAWEGAYQTKGQCVIEQEQLEGNINAQGWGQPANRGVQITGEADAGSFGNPNLLEED